MVKNSTGQEIRFREHGSKDAVLLKPDERHSLGFLRTGAEPQLVLSFPGGPTEWCVALTVVPAAVS